MKRLLLLIYCLQCTCAFSQNAESIKWWNPTEHDFNVIEGQAWPEEVKDPYDRLPAKAQGEVSDVVYHLGSQSAGLMIRFRSNAEEILVRYGVKNQGVFSLDHMPATGVSGLDLYAIDSEGKELWCAARRSFSDTITYQYQGLRPNDTYHKLGREYRLYLPLYNQVTWLEIGVNANTYFEALPLRKEKPIVIYGTSIAQGACASRPGMAWTAILGRKMDRPLINLGFSGSGLLESPVIDLMAEIDAKIYILDCLPNLVGRDMSDKELKERVVASVHQLKAKKPLVQILLVDHGGYTDGLTNDAREQKYKRGNQLQQEAFYQLKKEGYQGLFYLTKEDIGLQLDDLVDGTHPTDLGMMRYAESYEKKLRSILNEPVGMASTTLPVTQYREPQNYDWQKRHNEILELNTNDAPNTVILANSIIHFWGGLPRAKLVREEDSWARMLTPMGVRNYAYGWDRIENVLWRVYHGELDGFAAERVMVMIGTNNLHLNSDEEILEGLHLLIQMIKDRQPKSEIVLMGLLPRRDYEQRISSLNLQIAQLAGDLWVKYADLGGAFLNADRKINESLFSDGLHPNAAGYLKLGEAWKPLLTK